MGSNDVPPAHVPSHVVPICGLLLQVGGALWTLCYILMVRDSFRTRTYGMPLFTLALNFSWELVYALFVVESPLEATVFSAWLLLDCGMVYAMLKYGKKEWNHAPFVQKWLGTIFVVSTVYCSIGQYAFAKWWIDNEIGKREGKFYRGVMGPDVTELGFWSTASAQAYLSVASLAQLLVRQHSGGVSWSSWAVRTLGSIIGHYLHFGWAWYFWPEAHEYFVSPFGIFLWVTGLVCDLIYPFVLYSVQRTETTLPDGSKASGGPGAMASKLKKRAD